MGAGERMMGWVGRRNATNNQTPPSKSCLIMKHSHTHSLSLYLPPSPFITVITDSNDYRYSADKWMNWALARTDTAKK